MTRTRLSCWTGRRAGTSDSPSTTRSGPAPKGSFAAVSDRDRRHQTGLLDLTTGRVRWIQIGARSASPEWSPDGSRLLLTLGPVGGVHFGIVQADSGRFRKYPVPSEHVCTDTCRFTWMPDGAEVAYQQTDPDRDRSESRRHPRLGLRLFSADTGLSTRLLPIRSDVASVHAWSPDGRHAVVQGQGSPQLVNATTGEVIRELPTDNVYWAGSDKLVFRDGERARVVDLAGQTIASQPLPKELHPGYVLSIAPR